MGNFEFASCSSFRGIPTNYFVTVEAEDEDSVYEGKYVASLPITVNVPTPEILPDGTRQRATQCDTSRTT